MIEKLDLNAKSLLFAKLSRIAYNEEKVATVKAQDLGFTSSKFYDNDWAQAYIFKNDIDLVISCRGTQPNEWGDIKADINALPVISETVSRVHRGFKESVDDLWPEIEDDISKEEPQRHWPRKNKTVWICGHSLGAAMGTIMASRLQHNNLLDNPFELYTYGSPRVGWPRYVKEVGVKHYRWKNNNDIVTTVPLILMGYRHHGEEHYLNAYGKERSPTGWQRFKDKLRGYWFGIKKGKIDSFSDHSIDEYIRHIESSNS